MGDRKIACGHLRNRHEVIQLLQNLSAGHQLMGRGIGWVDVHLLASAKLSGYALWTLDRRLAVIALGAGGDGGLSRRLSWRFRQGSRAAPGFGPGPAGRHWIEPQALHPKSWSKAHAYKHYRLAQSEHLSPMTSLSVFLSRMVTSLASTHPADLESIHSTHGDAGAHRQSLLSAAVCSSPVFPSPAVQPAAR